MQTPAQTPLCVESLSVLLNFLTAVFEILYWADCNQKFVSGKAVLNLFFFFFNWRQHQTTRKKGWDQTSSPSFQGCNLFSAGEMERQCFEGGERNFLSLVPGLKKCFYYFRYCFESCEDRIVHVKSIREIYVAKTKSISSGLFSVVL